jgi:hypothetical protein
MINYVGKFYVAVLNSIARKFHNNKEKIERKGWGPIYLFGLRAAMINFFFSYVLIFFFNNSSLFMSMPNLI